MANYDQFQIGAVVSPVTTSLTNTLLLDVDPALNATLKFLTSVLKTHFEARFLATAASVNYKQGDGTAFVDLVPSIVHYDPAPFLVTAQYKFPMLALFRTKTTKVEDHSFAYQMKESLWNLYFILPPFDVRQAVALTPMFNEIENVIINKLKLRHSPTYQSNDLILDNAGICDISVLNSELGEYKVLKDGGKEVVYPTLAMELKVTERQNYVAEPLLSGIDVTQDITDDLGTRTIITSAYDVTPTTTWTPASIATKLWLKADKGVVLNGVHVTAWQDQSGNGNDASQTGVISAQPILLSNWKNGLPAVYFDGNDVMQINSTLIGTTNGQAFTMAIVHQFDDLSVSRTSFLLASRLSFQANPDGSGKRSITKHGVSFCTDGAATTTAEQWVVTGKVFDPTNVSKLYVNGTDTAIIASTAIILTPVAPCFVGGLTNTPILPMFGSVAEIVVSNYQWSPTEIANWTLYVHQRYGI